MMRRYAKESRRGFTLLECLVYTALLSMVTVATMHALAQSRLTQANGRDRIDLAVRAQETLDRVRREGMTGLPSSTRTDEEWGFLQVDVADGPTSGTRLLQVTAGRETLDRTLSVRLDTLVSENVP